MSTPLLSLSGVSKTCPGGQGEVTILRDIDLTIDAGEMLAIVGPSGSGKSTLMHLLGCLDRPSTGSYRVKGALTADLGPDALAALRREHFGFIFQRYHLLNHLSAEENVEMPSIYRGALSGERRRRARALLGQLGMAARVDHRPTALSGGQQQRVSIARALMNGGDVILADEPTGALDSRSGADVMAILRSLHRAGHTVIIVTHDMAVARTTNRIVEIADGRIISDEPNAPVCGAAVPVSSASGADGAVGGGVAGAVAGGVAGVEAGAVAGDEASYRPSQNEAGARRPGSAVLWMAALLQQFAVAYAAIVRHRLRTGLTMLGIMMGIAAVVSMVAFGEGQKDKILAELDAFGADSVYIYPGVSYTDHRANAIRTLSPVDVSLLQKEPYIAGISPVVYVEGELRRGSVKAQAKVEGVNEHYFRIGKMVFAQGGAFGEDAVRTMQPIAVIDDAAKRTFFAGIDNPVGQTLLVGQMPTMVVGVLAPNDSTRGDMSIYMPVTTVQVRLTSQHYFPYLRLALKQGVSNEFAEPLITALLTHSHRIRDFRIVSFDKQVKAYKRTTASLSALIVSIAFVSLLIAGIGVMNTMLVSVTERTGEIGIRMAVGARQADIRRQFLFEALIICSLGGIAGVALSFGVVLLVPWLAPSLPVSFSLFSIIAACVSSTVIGIAFGYIPARNAARLDPIQALSHA